MGARVFVTVIPMSVGTFERLKAALDDRYRVEGTIGEGGMATVYRAEDLRHHRQVALKVLRAELAVALGPERFLREIRITARLSHPHILPLLDSGEADGLLYFVTPYLEGESLRERIAREPQLPVEEALRMTAEIADALDYAHGHGIVHRDIKPGNILISSGHAVVADFGIARAIEAAGGVRLTESAIAVGTPVYMSPEQMSAQSSIDGRSDVYSLGCVLYEMLVGEPPYTGRTTQAILAKRLITPVPSARALREGVPTAVDQALQRALAKAPADRFPTAGQLVQALTTDRTRAATPDPARRGRWRKSGVVGTVGLAMAGAWLAFLLRPSGTLAYTEGDWLLVTDFANATGDTTLDESLDVAFNLTLQQSPVIKVFPTARIQRALGRMMLDPASDITESVGQEIAEREGVRLVLAPSIAAVGGRYVLGLAVHDAAIDEPVHTEVVRVEGRDEILSGLDELAARVRRALGAEPAPGTEPAPLSQVTTASLPALRQFSLGARAFTRFGNPGEARRFFTRAVTIDTTFAGALAQLGAIELEFFDRDRGIQYLSRALAHVDRLTDYESRMVRGLYADLVDHDMDEAETAYQSVAALFPNAPAPRNNLGWLYWRMGRYEDAATEYREALGIDEGFNWAFRSLGMLQLSFLGRLDSALVGARRQIERDERYNGAWQQLGLALIGKDSLDAADSAFRRAAALDPGEPDHLRGLANALWMLGRTEEAADALRAALELDPSSVDARYELGLLYQSMGDSVAALSELDAARANLAERVRTVPDDGEARAMLSLVLSRLGESERAGEERRIALDQAPTSAPVLFHLARVAMAEGDPSAALGYLERAVEQGFTEFLRMKVDPDLAPLKEDERFTGLIASMIH